MSNIYDESKKAMQPFPKRVCDQTGSFLLTVPDLVHKCKQLCILKALDLGYGHYEHTMQPDP